MDMYQTIAIYRQAIDPTARIDEGVEWWAEVQAEMIAVADAPSLASATSVIEWWHHDWTAVRDSARAAAGRIRRAAKRVSRQRASAPPPVATAVV